MSRIQLSDWSASQNNQPHSELQQQVQLTQHCRLEQQVWFAEMRVPQSGTLPPRATQLAECSGSPVWSSHFRIQLRNLRSAEFKLLQHCKLITCLLFISVKWRDISKLYIEVM